MSAPRYSGIEVELVGQNGNAFSIISRVQRHMRQAGLDDAEIREFVADATSGDYAHLLRVVGEWVTVS